MNRLARASIVALMVVACAEPHYTASPTGPAVTMAHHVAEGHNPDFVPAASSSATSESSPAPSSAPQPVPQEPEPLRVADQWQYELSYDSGSVLVASATPKHFPHPIVTKRNLGRFAVELWIGRELVDRVRFDFPLVGGDIDRGSASAPRPPPALSAGARTRVTVLVPASSRARRAVLVDAETKTTTPLPWPPDHPLPPPEASAAKPGSQP